MQQYVGYRGIADSGKLSAQQILCVHGLVAVKRGTAAEKAKVAVAAVPIAILTTAVWAALWLAIPWALLSVTD
jgi:uncharacterized membrane protein